MRENRTSSSMSGERKRDDGYKPQVTAPLLDSTVIKAACGAPVVANSGYTLETAQAAIAGGQADAIAFVKLFLANPDLPARLGKGGPFNTAWDMKTFYGGTEKGYTDYPAMG